MSPRSGRLSPPRIYGSCVRKEPYVFDCSAVGGRVKPRWTSSAVATPAGGLGRRIDLEEVSSHGGDDDEDNDDVLGRFRAVDTTAFGGKEKA